jgi:hypothetical protein
MRISGLCLILLIVSVTYAKTVSLTGTVSNQKNNPIAGAIVNLTSQKLSDTTDSKGAYSLIASNAAVTSMPLFPSADRISINQGIIQLSLSKSAPVRIELYDMRGVLLEKTLDRETSAGNYRFDLMANPFACRMMAIRVSVAAYTSTFRYLPLTAGLRAVTGGAASSSFDRGLAKIQAGVDSLTVSASGFITKTVKITSYETTLNITLDSNTSSLGKFSFFITSLKALQTLSNNSKGFGGNFSFGKTGQGAGLLGADSICQCIAEMSMPGSKVKQWRAFLSVTKDASGNKVNAIDRIGQGPWYDRLGRVVSPDKTGLLATRPNADAAIKNDLPNENGIPNHRPDPNAAQVDNHHMVTGSNTSGQLNAPSSDSTCADWTSTTANGKPRCGFSWPRNMGGMGKTDGMSASHWISGFNAAGCAPSVESTVMSGIGGGGGYGGFYCFALTP